MGFKGTPPTGPDFCLGDWIYRFHIPNVPEHAQRQVYQSFHTDFSAPARARDGSFDNTKDRWAFNDDKSLSLWSYVEAMPDYGIDAPTYSEDRYHVLIKDPDSFVLFNGDGSLIMVYTRVSVIRE